MEKPNVSLTPLQPDDRNRFILDNQEAFKYGALEEFGCRDTHFEEDGEIISRATIEKSIDDGEAYRIICDGQIAGGVVVKVDGENGDLDLLFVSPKIHSKGITQNPGKDLFGISIYYCGEIDSRRLTVDDISNVC